uniref:Uncharacterized protein n=1 Tax=Physcomitrium patens TaxID=3218 RepID=A0A2K1LB19_PHYPA|nr:hypothetical protein PHYPA_001653 [Physcomitrium patens]
MSHCEPSDTYETPMCHWARNPECVHSCMQLRRMAAQMCTVLYDFIGPAVLASAAFVGVLSYAGLATLWPLFESTPHESPTLKNKPANSLTRIYKWSIQPIVDVLRLVIVLMSQFP